MAEIKCPNCGTLISLEQSDLDSIVRQVRDEEFSRDLQARIADLAKEKEQAIELARMEEQVMAERKAQAKDAQISQLEAQLKLLQQQVGEQLTAQREQMKAQHAAALADAKRAADAQVSKLQAQLDAQADTFEAKQQLAVSQAVSKAQEETSRLQAAVEVKESEKVALGAQLRDQMAQEIKVRDEIIKLREEELERMKDLRSRMSTKMIGESLEQHCQNEFNRIRATAFPNAYFEKDTETVGGTKGDFIFREKDESGNEIISIMFEMKNESDSESRKTRNEDHFGKLDKDRTKKDCEYAILVSLLEPESELYNEGIVDVSYRYPKMYVVRPQFFLPIISLLRNAALNSLRYKQEAALMRQQNLDITNFEAEIEAFKTGFFRNYELASKRYEDAIGDIDRTIALLEKIKDNLTKSEKHLSAANNKLDDLTVKKLTRKNPTVRAMFDDLHADESAEEDEPEVAEAEAVEVEPVETKEAEADAAETGEAKADEAKADE